MRRKDLNAGMQEYIDLLLKEERYSTAKSYQDAWNSFIRFSGLSYIPYTFINKDTLRRYECYLLHNGCKRNTVSTYMRRLRCIYNRAVEQGDAPYVPRLFSDVFTGVESKCKRSLPLTELHKLMTVPVPRPALRSTQLAICLMFQYGGISFVDFAHLKKDNFQDDCLVYHRQKTGTTIQLEKLKSSLKMQSELSHSTPALSPYVFPFLSGSKKGKDSYWEYQGALQSFNRHLKKLGEYASKCDYVILVGEKTTKPIQDGLDKCGYKNYEIVKDVYEAFTKLSNIQREHKNLLALIENDLTDSYS